MSGGSGCCCYWVPLAASPPDALAKQSSTASYCVAIAVQIEIETHARFMRKSTSTLFYDPGLPVLLVAAKWNDCRARRGP